MSLSIFVCHASEDKIDLARPLAYLLRSEGFHVWYDEFELKLGDSLIETIDKGLALCDYAVIILSPNFFSKNWTKRELAGLATRELQSGAKILLPVWHNINVEEICKFSPPLADRLGILSSVGLEALSNSIKKAVNKDSYETNVTTAIDSVIYKSVQTRYKIVNADGSLAIARKTNWLYTKENNITTLRDGGMSSDGKYKNMISNLGKIELQREGGPYVAYTKLIEPLIPNKIYEHYLEYEVWNSYLEKDQVVGMNVSRHLESIGSHVFFPDGRKPFNITGKIIGNNKTVALDPFIAVDNSYINIIVENPPVGSLVKLEWEW